MMRTAGSLFFGKLVSMVTIIAITCFWKYWQLRSQQITQEKKFRLS